MRPRPLQEDSPIIRATGYADLSVSAGTVFKQAFQAPAAGFLLAQSWETSGSIFESLTEQEREVAREAQRIMTQRKNALEGQLDYETDPTKREQLLGEVSKLYEDQSVQRDTKIQEMVEDGRLLSVEALTEEFGDLLKFDMPMTRDKAKLLYKNKQESRVRDAIINKGLDGISGYGALIGGSLLSAAVDPIELVAAFIPVVGQAGRAAAVARFGRVGGAALVGTAEGFVGSLLTEPLYYGLSKHEQLDYSMNEALLNIGVGTLLGSGIGTVRGMFDVRRPNYKEIVQDLDIADDILPELPRLTREQSVQIAARNRLNAIKNYDILGGTPVAQTVLRQFVTDQVVNASPVMPRFAKQSAPPVEDGYVRVYHGGAAGSLDDIGSSGRWVSTDRKYAKDYGAGDNVLFYTDLEKNDPRINPDPLNAEQTVERGFTFNFELTPQEAAQLKKINDLADEIETPQEHKKAIAEQVKDLTGKDLTDEEATLLARTMANENLSLEEAAKDIQLKLYEAQAEKLARYASSPKSDIGADVDAAEQFDIAVAGMGDEFDFDAELQQNDAILRQYQDAGELTNDDIKAIAELQQVEETMDAYIELVQAAAICTARA